MSESQAPQGVVRAPEIARPGLQWFNVAQPLSLGDLRGKIVLLDFWTFCCINCMHILPTLRKVEETFPNEVVVIGVHSPKFAAEKDGANVARAIARYGVVHPVVHDPEFQVWRQYAIRAWPTLVFVGPMGEVLGQTSGEPDPDKLIEVVGALVSGAKQSGLLQPSPLALTPEAPPDGPLRFPGKLKPIRRGDGARQWILADAGHHQLAVLDDNGQEVLRVGSGEAGFDDGTLDSATFNGPQGLIADGDVIYIADTGNHAIRRADLVKGTVNTLAGTGRRGMALGDRASARQAALASPWDLELDDTCLYFANAGSHQLGVLDLAEGTVRALAGDSGEAIDDGEARRARLAQPSGLVLDREARALYFVDSETSAVRVVEDLDGAPRVRTLVGTGLFDFGHENGALAEARFQHPLGIARANGTLLIADSYNGALRAIDLDAQQVSDYGEDFICQDSVCIPAAEPAGVWAEDGRVFLVDTNNHRVLAYDPAKREYRTWVG
jgi:thiol-disulfide isomerase/thioredoxin